MEGQRVAWRERVLVVSEADGLGMKAEWPARGGVGTEWNSHRSA